MRGSLLTRELLGRKRAPPHQLAMAGVVTVAPLFVATAVGSVLPVTPEQLELLQAGGAIIGVLTAGLIWLTFGQLHAREERRKSAAVMPRPELAGVSPVEAPRKRRDGPAFGLAQISRHDTAFSEVDVHRWLHDLLPAALAASEDHVRTVLRPYVAFPAFDALRRSLAGAQEVQIGTTRLVHAEHDAWDSLRIEVGLSVLRGGGWVPVLQQWVLRRSTSARSLPLADMRALGCPSCGSPVHLGPPEWTCAACERRIGDGQLHWQLIEAHAIPDGALRDPRWAPVAGSSGGEHASMLVPMPNHEVLASALRSLRSRCPEFDLRGVEARIHELVIRREGLASARRFEEHALAHLGLVRVESDTTVEETQLVRVERDGWYERIDVRVVLCGVHALVDGNGSIIDGNPEHPRRSASVLRLAARSGEPCSPDAWELWSVATPEDYVA